MNTTNNENAYKTEEGDRRLFMIKCTNERLTDEFYNQYVKDSQDEDNLINIFYYFKNRKILYTKNEAPMTEYKKELIQATQPAYFQHIYKKPYLYAGKTLGSSTILEMVNEYAKKKFITTNYSIKKFGGDYTAKFGEYKIKSSTIKYKFPELIQLKKKLYELDKNYYKLINNFTDEEEPNFTDEYEADDDNDLSKF
jgi:hypothetical protein